MTSITNKIFKLSCAKKGIEIRGHSIELPYVVTSAWSREETNCLIVLMDPSENISSPRFHNLIAYDLQKPPTLKYEAELPTMSGPDCYTQATVRQDVISAFSFSCFRCIIDMETGKIVKKTFTK